MCEQRLPEIEKEKKPHQTLAQHSLVLKANSNFCLSLWLGLNSKKQWNGTHHSLIVKYNY